MSALPLLSVINGSWPKTVQTGQAGITPKTIGEVPPQFSEGQLLRATVLSVKPDNQYLLETGGSRILVKSQTQLEPGSVLQLKVLGSGAEPRLQLIPDQVSHFFNRSFADIANNLDITSAVTRLLQVTGEQSKNLNGPSGQTLREFSLLQQLNIPTPRDSSNLQGVTVPRAQPDTGLARMLVNLLLHQPGEQPAGSATEQQGGQPAASMLFKTVRDISLLFVEKEHMVPSLQKQIKNLPPAKQQLLDVLMQIQLSVKTKTPGENPFNQLVQLLQLHPESLTDTATLPASFNTLKAGLSDLIFLLKGPESVLQLFANKNLPAGMLPRVQPAPLHGSSAGRLETPDKAGEQLRQLITSLGLDFENRLARGDRDGAAGSVKASLMELLQSVMGQGKMAESAGRAVNTIEFLQLLQLHLERQDTLVLPLPLPYLEQGYLVIENYREQLAEKTGDERGVNRFSLYLKLSPLGNLRIDFLYSGDGLYIRFASDSETASDFMRDFEPELREAVSNTAVHSVSFSLSGEDPLTAILKKDSTGDSPFLNTTA